jgi:O-antigen biosynthesis protein
MLKSQRLLPKILHKFNALLFRSKIRLKYKFIKLAGKISEDRKFQAKNFWEANPAVTGNQWVFHPIIQATVNQRISGNQTSKYWLAWLIEDFFAGKNFENLLSPGCGAGSHEILMGKLGFARQIDAFDFSDTALQIARENASEAGVTINFYNDDINKFNISNAKKYDLVFCSGSLHHVKEIERFLSTVQQVLKPEGYFIVNEYVGDCYNIYKSQQMQLLNRLYQCFPDVLRSSPIPTFSNQTIQQVLATDPSESVRAKLILPFLEYYFDIEVMRPYGGGILHPLYPLLNHRELLSKDPKSETIVRLLLELEAILMELPGGLETDFCLCILKPKQI